MATTQNGHSEQGPEQTGLKTFLSISYLSAKIVFFLLLSMRFVETVVIAYQKF